MVAGFELPPHLTLASFREVPASSRRLAPIAFAVMRSIGLPPQASQGCPNTEEITAANPRQSWDTAAKLVIHRLTSAFDNYRKPFTSARLHMWHSGETKAPHIFVFSHTPVSFYFFLIYKYVADICNKLRMLSKLKSANPSLTEGASCFIHRPSSAFSRPGQRFSVHRRDFGHAQGLQ